ncbi:MAG: 2,3-bisphosphoglycerate-independent phosphoglycerate mutase [Deltaproteobacteria bacterium]|nr:2,3-bisphosphoglycerate-independent phosphoglycerate mutase [Deltaproteobacteria bacterium]
MAHPLLSHFAGRFPLVWIVLDGWGIGSGDEGDAITHAHTPVMEGLRERFAHSALLTHGPHVGLPSASDIGGSEVGHLTMGAGKVFPQGPTRIQEEIQSGRFFQGETLTRLMDNCLTHSSALHLIGLLSDGNVHSHIDHFQAIVDHAATKGIRRVYLHALLDGRDVAYQSAEDYLDRMDAQFAKIMAQHPGFEYGVASGGGREVITMDRDHNWVKVHRGWEIHVMGKGPSVSKAQEAVAAFRKENPQGVDQDIPPFVVTRNGRPLGPMAENDSVIFMNFRGDRAIEFTQAMVLDNFNGFHREVRPKVLFAGMMVYDEDTYMPPLQLMGPSHVEQPFGRRLMNLGIKQFRLAETQKYAHITFFFNGGYREPLDNTLETYQLIPSDNIASFAQAPRMKAQRVAEAAAKLISSGEYKFGLINFANADMVGHTGVFHAVVEAVEAVDQAVGVVLEAVEKSGGVAIVTADHGNADQMLIYNPKTKKQEPSTRHSINPVPLIVFDPKYKPGDYRLKPFDPENPLKLSNLAATAFVMLGIDPPEDMDPAAFDI